jgi:hypothetical protein
VILLDGVLKRAEDFSVLEAPHAAWAPVKSQITFQVTHQNKTQFLQFKMALVKVSKFLFITIFTVND